MKLPLAAAICAIALTIAACAPSAPQPPVPSLPSAPPKLEPEWLATMNRYRRANDLQPVVEDPELSAADLNHARYLVKNRIAFSAGAGMHDENKSNQWYTSGGYWAGRSGDVVLTSHPISEAEAIEGWMGAPFHGLAILAPDLHSSGYGGYCEAGRCAAVLSIGHFSELNSVAKIKTREVFDYDSDAPEKSSRVELETPVKWPAPGVVLSNGTFAGREWPNPLSACEGYKAPTGVVIFASFGRDFIPEPQPEALTCDGAPVEHCVITAKNYTNPDRSEQDRARRALEYDAAVLMIPRDPIKPGTNCEVSLTVEGAESRWSFSVSPQAALDSSH